MGTKSLAIAVIHGIGSHGEKEPQDSARPEFSGALKDRLAKALKKDGFDSKVAWREIFWSHLTQRHGDDFLEGISDKTRWDGIRSFVVRNLADAASYTQTKDLEDPIYTAIHGRVTRTLGELEDDTAPGAPLIVLAHSMGAHIMSNHIWDMKGGKRAEGKSDFQRFRTLRAFVTFGCNIPLFLFFHDPAKLEPIAYPGPAPRIDPWWHNYYDKDDVLGFPLAPLGEQYAAMVENGALADIPINAGGVLDSWNPAAHNAYWKDEDFTKPVAKLIRAALK